MNLKNETFWNETVEKNKDPYGKCAVDVARNVMIELDKNEPFNANDLILKGDKEKELTGFLAGCVASIVSTCHTRGDEFKKSWNKHFNVESTEGTVNPAIITFEKKGDS